MKYIIVRIIINPITEKYSSLPISSAVFLSPPQTSQAISAIVVLR